MRLPALILALLLLFAPFPARAEWKGRDTAMVIAGTVSVALIVALIVGATRPAPKEVAARGYHPDDYRDLLQGETPFPDGARR